MFSLYYLFERRRIGGLGLLIAGLFLIAGAALSQSRTSWVMLAVLIVVAVIHKGLLRKWRWQRLAMPVLVMMSFYYLSVVLADLKDYLFFAEGGSAALRASFTDVRTDLWLSFIQAIAQKPWFGYGWGQVSIAQVAAAEMHPAIGLAQYSHNLLLDLLIWNGIPIGLLFFAMISYLWVRVFAYAYTVKGFYSLCCFTVLLVHSLLEYPHAYSYFLLLAGFFIGISAADPLDHKAFRRGRVIIPALISATDRWLTKSVVIPKYIPVVLIMIFSVSLVVAWRDYRVLEEDHRLLRFENASIGPIKADKKAPDVWVFDQLRGFTWVSRTKTFDDLNDQEQALLEKVAIRYPVPATLYKLAQLRTAQEKPAEAEKALELIKHLHGERIYEAAKKEWTNLTKKGASSSYLTGETVDRHAQPRP